MIDLAISVDDDAQGLTIVETNYGDRLTAPHWPQDSDFRLVAFSPTAKECAVIAPRELARDIAVIGVIQLCALLYGSALLWKARPLYYAFSENVLQLVQAYDIGADELARARREHAALIPHWYSLPRWIWAPLPEDAEERGRIVAAAVTGGDDVISMPRYYKPWEAGLPTLRTQLKKVDDVGYFVPKEKTILKEKLRAAGYSPDLRNAIPMTGRGRPLLAVFDPATVTLLAFFTVK